MKPDHSSYLKKKKNYGNIILIECKLFLHFYKICTYIQRSGTHSPTIIQDWKPTWWKGSSLYSFFTHGLIWGFSTSDSLVQDDRHSAQCNKSSHNTSSVSDSGLVLSESCLELEQRELQLVPDLGASWNQDILWH